MVASSSSPDLDPRRGLPIDGFDGRTRVTQTSHFASPEEKRKHVEDFHAEGSSRELLERLEVVARG
jgi:hypothetical protein